MKQKVILLCLMAFTFVCSNITAQDDSSKIRTGATVSIPTATKASEVQPPLEIIMEQGADIPVDYSNPDSYFEEGLIGAMKAGLLAIIAALGGFIPGLRNLDNKWLRSGIVIFLALTALATFRQGALTENFVTMLTNEFLPNFAYAGAIYKAYQFILGLLPKKTAPAA